MPLCRTVYSGSFFFMKKPVLIVIDMLRDSLESWEPTQRERLVSSINELMAVTRSFSMPVIWMRQEFEPDLRDAFPEMRAKRIYTTIKGTKGCEILSELARAPSDIVIIKSGTARFTGPLLTKHSPGSHLMRSS
jgi:nicotinamidase-related amidase